MESVSLFFFHQLVSMIYAKPQSLCKRYTTRNYEKSVLGSTFYLMGQHIRLVIIRPPIHSIRWAMAGQHHSLQEEKAASHTMEVPICVWKSWFLKDIGHQSLHLNWYLSNYDKIIIIIDWYLSNKLKHLKLTYNIAL